MSLTWSPAVPCSGESSVGCGQGAPLGSQVLAFTGSSQTLWTPFHAGWAEAASLSGVSVSLCFCHTVPELKLGRARASASSVLAVCVCVAAEGRFPAPSSAPTATSPSWKETRQGCSYTPGLALQSGGFPKKNCKIQPRSRISSPSKQA